ncbi:MAG: DUF421 domain-containing protein [Acidimicrobiia bacterium]
MDTVLRAVSIYVALLVIFRVSGKRTLAQITTFDFVLLLIVGEATQQGLLGNDFSVTNALVVVATLVGTDIVLAEVRERLPRVDRLTEGLPVVILEDGEPIERRMKRARVEPADILAAGRQAHGIERLDQIKYAVLEQSGNISVVPRRDQGSAG